MIGTVTEQALTMVLFGVLGASVGSFLNVVVHRVPRGISIVRPPSACPACGAPVRPRDNLPVVSWLLLRGRCRSCGEGISVRYPVIELLTAVLFVGAAWRFERVEEAAFVALASAVLVALAFIDLEHRRVPNKIVLPAAWAAAVWVVAAAIAHGEPGPAFASLASGAAGFAVLFAIAIASGGMGFGDVKLAMFVGLVAGRLGWEAFALSLFAGFVAGGLVALGLLLSGRRGRKDAIPFAPMLCLGALVGLFAGVGPVRAWLGF